MTLNDNLEHTKKVWPGLARVRATPRAETGLLSAVHLATTTGVVAPHPALRLHGVHDNVLRGIHLLCLVR